MTDETTERPADALRGPTTELTFLGPSHDGQRLLLAASDGQRYELAVDARLIAVVSREHRDAAVKQPTAQRELPTPREIQDRIRHGETVDDLANAVGADTAEIERFANPVITERAHMAETARQLRVTIGSDTKTLQEAVLGRLRTRGIDVASTLWDAWRRKDGLWTVVVAYPITHGTQVATFTYDAGAQTVEAADDEARWLLELGVEPSRAASQSTPAEPKDPPKPTTTSDANPDRWDKAHPAARAAHRRENGQAQRRADESTDKASKELPKNDNWEELLFGSPED